MDKWLYPTAFSSWRPYDGGHEWAAAERVLRSGRLTMGAETERFEQVVAAYHGRRHAVAVNSGSSANLIAAAILDLEFRNPEVAVPAIAWSTTYAPFVQARRILKVVDVNDTWNAQAPNALASGAYVACSILGNPGYVDRWDAVGRNVPMLEDNCESFGAKIDGRLTGTFGDVSTGSGFYSHQVSAVELGWLLTDRDDLAARARLLRNHGNDGWGCANFDRQYRFTAHGYNLRPVDMHAAVAAVQVARADELIAARRANLAHFEAAVQTLPIVLPRVRRAGEVSPFALHFECADHAARARLAAALRGAGIDCRLPTGGSFNRHPYSAQTTGPRYPTPRADLIHDRGMFLGNAPFPIPDLIDAAVKIMKEVL